MKKAVDNKKNKIIGVDRGLPMNHLKELEKFKSKLRKELTEEMEKEKKKKGK